MSLDAAFPHVEALLAHQDFVRALAQGLVRDPATADDVVQETWISAWTNPPRALDSVRGWLARVTRHHALNARRAATRRARREELAARDENDDSSAALRESLALQQRVASAVLALREPYRSVILLHYHAGLSAAEIARKHGIPAGTVRSQITRGLDLLRSDLDREFGDRGTWSMLLVPLASGPAHAQSGGATFLSTTSAKLFAAALVLGTTLVVAFAWPMRSVSRTQWAALPVELSGSATIAPTPTGPATDPVSAGTTSFRAAVALPLPDGPSDAELASRSTRDLLLLALQVQRELRGKMLDPDAATRAKYAALTSSKDTGLARIVERTRYDAGGPLSGALGQDGNGSYWSFTYRTNDFQMDTSLKLEQWRLAPSRSGIIIDLGTTDTVAPLVAEEPPRGLDEMQRELWTRAWKDVHVTARGYDAEFDAWRDAFDHGSAERQRNSLEKAGAPKEQMQRRMADAQRWQARAEIDHTYLLRSFEAGKHDLLVTFTVIAKDEDGLTFAWRIVKRWPILGPISGLPTRSFAGFLPAAPEWMRTQTTAQLLETLGRLRTIGTQRLLGVPAEIASAQSARVANTDMVLARIVERGEWTPLVSLREGGAYYSFTTHSNDYNDEPDIALEQGTLESGFAGSDFGFVLDLGEIPLESLPAKGTRPPSELNEWQLRAWSLVMEAQSARLASTSAPRSVRDEWLQRGRELGVDRTSATLGHTYLVFSSQTDRHDVTAAFTLLAQDEAGYTFIARVLARLDAPATKSR